MLGIMVSESHFFPWHLIHFRRSYLHCGSTVAPAETAAVDTEAPALEEQNKEMVADNIGGEPEIAQQLGDSTTTEDGA
jgi:hypothetical protein